MHFDDLITLRPLLGYPCRSLQHVSSGRGAGRERGGPDGVRCGAVWCGAQAEGPACDVLEHAIQRYERVIRREAVVGRAKARREDRQHAGRRLRLWRDDPYFSGYLTNLRIEADKCETWPYPDMDETCE